MTNQQPIYTTKNTTIEFQMQVNSLPVPDVRLEFHTLPSWNDFLAISRHAGQAQGMVATWRKKGKEKALLAARRSGFALREWTEYDAAKNGRVIERKNERIEQPIERCKVILRYWRPTWANYDNFSPFIKPVVDGCVDAGLIADDNYNIVPDVQILFMGIDDSLKLSAEAKAEAKTKRAKRKKSLPTPSRFWLEFHRL